MVSLGSATVVAIVSAAATPLIIAAFSKQVRRPEGLLPSLWRIASTYHLHLLFFVVLYFQKSIVDGLNDPLSSLSNDYTWLIHAIEGDAVYWIQSTFRNDILTAVLNFNYLFGYTILIYATVFLFMWDGDRRMAGLMSLNYTWVYMLTVPLYLFFNVQVTSHFIPQMDSLLYHWNDFYLSFFSGADPLDNAFPSLHIGIPAGAWMLQYREMKRRGESPWAGPWGRHMWWLTAQILIYMFSIAYLGVHWLIDIPGGIFIAWVSVLLIEEFHDPFFRFLYSTWEKGRQMIGLPAKPLPE